MKGRKTIIILYLLTINALKGFFITTNMFCYSFYEDYAQTRVLFPTTTPNTRYPILAPQLLKIIFIM